MSDRRDSITNLSADNRNLNSTMNDLSQCLSEPKTIPADLDSRKVMHSYGKSLSKIPPDPASNLEQIKHSILNYLRSNDVECDVVMKYL